MKQPYRSPETPQDWTWSSDEPLRPFHSYAYVSSWGVGDPAYYEGFSMMLVDVPEAARVSVMQYLRTIQPNMGMMDAKHIVTMVQRGEPRCIIADISLERAHKIFHDLANLGVRTIPWGTGGC